jgi:hypothetical protein
VDDFLNGAQSLAAYPGAYIGQAAPDSETNRCLVRLRCQYADGNPMNTRELLYLLFGNDSQEAVNHPVMKRIADLCGTETILPISKRMSLRPPLRTHARVMWEAQTEVDGAPATWAQTKELGADDFCNEDSDFRAEGYKDDYKCNLFVEDICIRAGFRVPVWTVNGKNQYVGATYLAQLGYKVGSRSSPALLVAGSKVWGRKWDGKINAVSTYKARVDFINKMMDEEGRCFILAKQRNGRLPGGFAGLGGSAGHAAVIKQVLNRSRQVNGNELYSMQWVRHTTSDNQEKLLLQSITVKSYEAWQNGAVAVNSNWFFALWPGMPRDDFEDGDEDIDNQLALIELHPGKDPFTDRGLNDLNAVIG